MPEIGDEDILLKVEACGICGSDLHVFYGKLDPQGNVPYIMGHEFVGTIAKVGERVEKIWKVGDRIVSENTGGACGHCLSCAAGNFVNCSQRICMGCGYDGGFADYVKIPGGILKMYTNCIYHIPENLNFSEATLLEPAANAYKAVIQEGNLHAGQTVVVFGAGALGLMSVQMAAIGGAANVILVGLSSDKSLRFEIGRKYGATHLFASDEEPNLVEKIAAIAGTDGVSLVVDAAGAPSVTSLAFQIVRNEGTIIRIGMSDKPFNHGLDDFAFKSVTFRGHMGYNAESWHNVLNLARVGKLDLHSIITRELPLEAYEEGFRLMASQEAAKVVLIP